MDVRLLSLSDLSVACLCRTSPLSANLDVTNALPELLPSVAEVILANSAIVLARPFPLTLTKGKGSGELLCVPLPPDSGGTIYGMLTI